MTSVAAINNVHKEFEAIDADGSWGILYQLIRNESMLHDYTFEEAKKNQNKNLNRYRDVSPYDHTRIVLSRGPCNYINANLVKMESAHRQYILTQGPLPHTTAHFWLMIWEQNCKAVLMLNRVVEKNQIKCHQYWPLGKDNGGEDEMVFESVGLKVQHISEKTMSYYTTRVLRLTEIESGGIHDILHFHYTTWPDFGVPQSPNAFLYFLHEVRKSGALDENVGPPVVHCSAGIGRSGTFCLVDSCLVLIEENGIDSVNVREILLEMRKSRMGLIQTPDQLRFSYLAISEGAKICANGNMSDYEHLLENNSQHVEPDEIIPVDGNVDSEEPPPLPPPRGDSLSRSLTSDTTSTNENNESSRDFEDDFEPPDKPLPNEPPNNNITNSYNSNEDNDDIYSRPLPNIPCDSNSMHNSMEEESLDKPLPNEPVSSSDEGSYRTSSPPSSPETRSDKDSLIRKRKRDERIERTKQKVQDIKRKQKEVEKWQKMKRSLFHPLTIGLGVGALAGALAYLYFYTRG